MQKLQFLGALSPVKQKIGGEDLVQQKSLTENQNSTIIYTSQLVQRNLSFKRPYFNPRGGDSLRWEYPLVRWLEKNKLDVAYHTDLELETNHDLLTKYDYVITAGPMRYWTENTEFALKNFVHSGGNLVHLGAEAGQHLVALKEHKGYNDGQIILQPNEEYTDIGERLEE